MMFYLRLLNFGYRTRQWLENNSNNNHKNINKEKVVKNNVTQNKKVNAFRLYSKKYPFYVV